MHKVGLGQVNQARGPSAAARQARVRAPWLGRIGGRKIEKNCKFVHYILTFKGPVGPRNLIRGLKRILGGPLIFSEISRIFTFFTPRCGGGGVIRSHIRKLPK